MSTDGELASVKVGGESEDTKKLERATIKDLLSKPELSKKYYAVSILPQQMAWHVPVPRALFCGSREKQRE